MYSQEQIKRVLAGSGISMEGEVDTDYIIFCPFHNNYRTPAAEIDKESGTFYCFSCQHVADLPEVVMEVTGRKYFEAVRFIKSKEAEENISQLVGQKLVEKPEYSPFDIQTIKRLHETAMSSDRAMNYYLNRNITKESVEKFGLGYSEKRDMVTIPVYAPDGLPVGFVGRSVEGKDFKNTPGLPKSKVLFNLQRVRASNEVYVVESSFDVIRMDQVGLPAVATLGANVSNIQIELLKKYFNRINVIADNDEAGGNMVERIQEKLGSRVTKIQLNNKYKDVGDMDDDAIKNLRVSFDNEISSMLH